MKVIQKGRKQKGWSTETICSGAGNGGGGCEAELLVEFADLYTTQSQARDETDYYTTFCCTECGVETDLKAYSGPQVIQTKKELMKRTIQEASNGH